eukprot:jgi/Chlat1/8388/Chrsp80S00645
MDVSKARWGVLGTAEIAKKVIPAIQRAHNAAVVAIASRTLAKAEAWSKEHGIDKAHGSYDALLADPKVDAVYIPLPSALKCEWAVKAARAGKHVLVEKPYASVNDVQAIVTACEQSQVQFMDGTMFVHHVRTRTILQSVNEIGGARRVISSFTFPLSAYEGYEGNVRLNAQLEPLGCLGDVGWYCVKLALLAFSWELPTTVYATGLWSDGSASFNGSNVPFSASVVLRWADGRTSIFDCGFDSCWRGSAEIVGPKGSLSAHDMFLPFEGSPANFPNNPVNYKAKHRLQTGDGVTLEYTSPECIQEVAMIERLSAIAASKQLEPEWPRQALLTQIALAAVADALKQGHIIDVPQLSA